MRKKVFTEEVFARIPELVAQNILTADIAKMLGCSAASLKVLCSKRKISLRTPNWAERMRETRALTKPPKPPELPKPSKVLDIATAPRAEPVRQRPRLTMETSLTLSRVAMSRLRQQAELMNTTEAQLVVHLLETIVKDDLFNAVLGTPMEKAA